MSASVGFIMIVFVLLINTYIKNANINNEFIKEKAKVNIEIGRMTKAQMDELAAAQNLYFKTYKEYPSGGINELISKGFLRSSFQTTAISKNIKIDANNTITAINSKNETVGSYVKAHQGMVNSNDMKDKVLQNRGENIESLIENF